MARMANRSIVCQSFPSSSLFHQMILPLVKAGMLSLIPWSSKWASRVCHDCISTLKMVLHPTVSDNILVGGSSTIRMGDKHDEPIRGNRYQKLHSVICFVSTESLCPSHELSWPLKDDFGAIENACCVAVTTFNERCRHTVFYAFTWQPENNVLHYLLQYLKHLVKNGRNCSYRNAKPNSQVPVL